jgi:hypothetical protein
MSKRAHISLKVKLASALLALGHVPYRDAYLMTEDQIISLYHFDHNILHGIEAEDRFWNLSPMLIAAHREKSKRDTAIVAKSKRLVSKEAVHQAAMAANSTIDDAVANISRRMKRVWGSRKLQSRPFPKNKRKLRSNKTSN